MNAWLLVPAILSLLALGAHFLRTGNLVLVALSLGACVLLFIRKRWALRIVQTVLVLAAIEWLFTMYGIVQDRQAEGREWMRAAVILVAVAAIDIVAAGLLRLRRVL